MNDRSDMVRGDNNVIPIDRHPAGKRRKVALPEVSADALLDPNENHHQEGEGLKRESESGTHGSELPEIYEDSRLIVDGVIYNVADGRVVHDSRKSNDSPPRTAGLDRTIEVCPSPGKKPDEFVRNAVTRLGKVESCQGSSNGAFPCKKLINFLAIESEEPFEDMILIQAFDDSFGECLLCVLHADRLHGYDPGRFLSLGD